MPFGCRRRRHHYIFASEVAPQCRQDEEDRGTFLRKRPTCSLPSPRGRNPRRPNRAAASLSQLATFRSIGVRLVKQSACRTTVRSSPGMTDKGMFCLRRCISGSPRSQRRGRARRRRGREKRTSSDSASASDQQYENRKGSQLQGRGGERNPERRRLVVENAQQRAAAEPGDAVYHVHRTEGRSSLVLWCYRLGLPPASPIPGRPCRVPTAPCRRPPA